MAVAKQLIERTFEQVRDAADDWMGERFTAREAHTRSNGLGGFVVTLYDRGNPIATAVGTTTDSALEHALEKAGLL